MAITLYDLSVGCFLQTLGAVEGFLAKGLAHCQEKNIDPNEIVETRPVPGHAAVPLPGRRRRAPFGRRARRARRPAQFAPPGPSTADYAGLQKLVSGRRARRSRQLKPDEVNALEGKDVTLQRPRHQDAVQGRGLPA